MFAIIMRGLAGLNWLSAGWTGASSSPLPLSRWASPAASPSSVWNDRHPLTRIEAAAAETSHVFERLSRNARRYW